MKNKPSACLACEEKFGLPYVLLSHAAPRPWLWENIVNCLVVRYDVTSFMVFSTRLLLRGVPVGIALATRLGRYAPTCACMDSLPTVDVKPLRPSQGPPAFDENIVLALGFGASRGEGRTVGFTYIHISNAHTKKRETPRRIFTTLILHYTCDSQVLQSHNRD